MAYIETSSTSYWWRLWKSIKWFLAWILLVIISIWLLWWNEWRAIQTTLWLKEWQKILQNWSIKPINETLEWKLIYINWKAETSSLLSDDIFFIKENVIKLERKVQMYQWEEKEKSQTKDNLWWSETTTTTYSYNKKWSDKKIDSEDFNNKWYENLSEWKFKSADFVSNDVFVWDLKLADTFVHKLNKKNKLQINEEIFNKIKDLHKLDNAKLISNSIYIWSWNLNNPQIGDLLISFSVVRPDEVSIVWQQKWTMLTWYRTKYDKSIELLQYWKITSSDLFKKAFEDNSLLTWWIRIVWLILMFIWFRGIFNILVIIAKFIPFIASILSLWTWLISLFLTLIIGWWIIIIAWFFVRPVISISILITIITIIFIILKSKKNNHQNLSS